MDPLSIPPHFHKAGSPEGQVSEIDIIPDGTVLPGLPQSAPEGAWAVVDDGDTKKLYRMIKGAWQLIGPVTLADISPTTTKGDLIVRTDTVDDRLPVGENGQIPIADSNQSTGIRWDDNKSLKQIVSFIGPTPSAGDLLTNISAQSAQTIYRIEGASWDAADFGTTGTQKKGVRFKAPFSFTLKTLKIYLKTVGSPYASDLPRIAIYSDSAGSPGSSLASVTEGGATGSINQFSETFNLALTGGTYYWIVFERTGSNSDTDYYQTYENQTGLTLTDFHPDTAAKVFNGAAWSTRRTGSRYELIGDVTAGWQKYWGARTNIDIFPQLGVVESVNGSQATIVLDGYISGLSGLTRGAFLTINGVKAGICQSTTEAFIFSRKSITLKNLSLANTAGYQLNLPMGFTHLTEVTTNNPTIAAGTGKERLYTIPGATSSITVSLTDEYEAI